MSDQVGIFDDLLGTASSEAVASEAERRRQDAARWALDVSQARQGAARAASAMAAAVGAPLATLASAETLAVVGRLGARFADPSLVRHLGAMAHRSPDGRAHICDRCASLIDHARRVDPHWLPPEARSWLVGRRRYWASLCAGCARWEADKRQERRTERLLR